MTSTTTARDCVLLVDPDTSQGRAIRESLADANLELIETTTLEEALAEAHRTQPRLVLSELVLPDGSGFALCRQLRESSELTDVPIMMISRWRTERDRVLAFECGADDFLGKPYFQRELASRIKAVLRRSEDPVRTRTDEPTQSGSALSIDAERREAMVAGESIALTPREFELLAALSRHRGRVLSRADLIAEAWRPGERPTERSVDAHVKSLRRKLGEARDAIETVRGLGYRFSERNLGAPARLECP